MPNPEGHLRPEHPVDERAVLADPGQPVHPARAEGTPGDQQRLGETTRSAFPALRARVDGGDTVLTGVLADQAAPYGVLAEAEALGLELIEVRRLPPDEPRQPPS